MENRHFFLVCAVSVIVIASLLMTVACKEEYPVISKPDEYTRVYEANEKTILQAIAQVFKDKEFGKATVNYADNRVESDYSIQDNWRTKCNARIKRINWKACEVTLSVIAEKKKESGWEMRRFLSKKQYDSFFDAIDLQIYKELYKTE